MKIFDDVEQLKTKGTIIAVGKFDGVHKGHRKLISDMMDNKNDLETLVFTFRQENEAYFLSSEPICSNMEQISKFEKLGVDIYISFPLNETNIHIKACDFVKDILVDKLKMKKIICGEDFHFGYNKEGDVTLLKQLETLYGYETLVISKEEYAGSPISSSRIRKAITEQNQIEINAML